MYFTWFGIAFIMFCTKRYLKTFWFVTDIFHIMAGIFMLAMTVWTVIVMIDKYGITKETHSVLGFIMLALVILLGLNGTASAISARFG